MTEACPTCRGDLTVGPVLSEPHPWCPTCGGIKGLRRVGTIVIGDDETAVYPAPGVRIDDETPVYVLWERSDHPADSPPAERAVDLRGSAGNVSHAAEGGL